MARLIAALVIVAVLTLAAVVLVELNALSPQERTAPEAGLITTATQHARVPLRVAAATACGLLALAVIIRQNRPRIGAIQASDEPVIESETFSPRAKRTMLVISVLMMIVGGLGLLGFGMVAFFYFAPLAAALALAFAAGGATTFLQVRASLSGIPSRRLRLPPPWALYLAFVLVVAAGEAIRQLQGQLGLSFVLMLFLGAALPPLTVVSLATQEVGLAPTRRRVAIALVAGGTISVIAAVVLDIILPGIVALLALPAGDLVRELIALIDQGKFSDLLRSPASVLMLAQLAVIAPLVEEAVKPLGVIVLGGRIRHARDALVIGMACGAGFGIIENIMYEGGGLHLWTGITVVRGIGGALHPFGAGLLSLGWYGVFHRESGAWGRLARYYLVAVGAHALWNGASGIFLLLESASRGVLGPVDLQGVIIDVGLVALFLVEGIGLIFAVRHLARGVGAPGVPVVVVRPARALALWGAACLGVLLPVGVAAGHAVLRYLGATLLR